MPLIVIGIFTRYIVILILPVLLLYYIYNKGIKIEKEDLKYIIKGIILAIIIAAIIIIPVWVMGNGYFGVNEQIAGEFLVNKVHQLIKHIIRMWVIIF